MNQKQLIVNYIFEKINKNVDNKFILEFTNILKKCEENNFNDESKQTPENSKSTEIKQEPKLCFESSFITENFKQFFTKLLIHFESSKQYFSLHFTHFPFSCNSQILPSTQTPFFPTMKLFLQTSHAVASSLVLTH